MKNIGTKYREKFKPLLREQIEKEAYQEGVRKGIVMGHPQNNKEHYDWAKE